MESQSPRSAVDAVYHLRDAMEVKARAERELERDPSLDARDALLAAQLDVESKTQDVLDSYTSDEPRAQVTARTDNVLHVDFRPRSTPPPKR